MNEEEKQIVGRHTFNSAETNLHEQTAEVQEDRNLLIQHCINTKAKLCNKNLEKTN